MAASILRARGVTNHLLPLAAGFKKAKFRPQGREGILEKLQGFCQVLEESVEIANKDLERLILARDLMNRVADKGERARFVQQPSVSWTKEEHRSGGAWFDAVLMPILPGVIPQRCLQSRAGKACVA
ncbi:DUF1612 domain-containing protein [Microvirga tunisiensis]|jgi:hypothetical protein|uniref:DUF1612 domain-containing protein n=1 Tax=Microvirga tunisiensis TaxID=2108360 RepID=UPI001FCECA53|nr:DUF1612 domain-containing protein [Microvirga tunisiensis]